MVAGNDNAIDNLTKKIDDLINALSNTIRNEIDKTIPPIMKAIKTNKKECEEHNGAVDSELM